MRPDGAPREADASASDARADLATLQRRFFALITAPRGVAAGLDEVAASDAGARPLRRWIVARDEQQATERLDIYANMYFYRLLDVLGEDFAACVALAGGEDFHDAVTDYLLAHPPSTPSLRDLGERFAAFLASHALSERLAALPDLARYEWGRVSVFDRVDQRALSRGDLASVAPEALPERRLRFIAAHTTLALDHRVHEAREALAALTEQHDGEGALAPAALTLHPQPGALTLAVWRRGVRVHTRELSAVERELAALVAAGSGDDGDGEGGATFGDLCEALAVASGDADSAVREAAGVVARWADEEMLLG